jgi:type III restriction enzyme
MNKLYLQNIVENIHFDKLPANWQEFDFVRFSKDKELFNFQRQGLQNVLKGLWLYYKEYSGDKQSLYNHYLANDFEDNFDYDLKKKEGKKAASFILKYDKDYPATNSIISFSHFINRMSFWMATGSGKTLVIVKLIELIGHLNAQKELPKQDILFLAHREDLLDQFKSHVDEFNSFNFGTRINLKNLREYENVKRENILSFIKNEITVFYYRSDLISDIHKDKYVDFRNYDNNGQWYILLDEAHKGDKEDSKRQILYSILSRNGFLFNFSATFTDPRDFATCVFNFNLSRFVEDGYGKHIYLSASAVSAFRDKSDFSPLEKQKIVLKSFLLLTYINKHYENIRKVYPTLYHQPLLLTLVNSVDVEDADLQLVFKEIERVASNDIKHDLFQSAKQELVQDFQDYQDYLFEDTECIVNADLILKLSYKDVLNHVLNAKTPGNIEILKIPGNKQELIFKLKTAEKPFALIKIGDVSGWLKDKLEGYEIVESFENESYFKRLNQDDSDINILMGSRAFYEGWDSNRPNLLMFVNIGIGSDAKKFVLQSVGRGLRIEPIKHKRKRLQNLFNAKEIEEELFNKVKNFILPIESLFIFGTNTENLKEIIRTLQSEKQDVMLGEVFIINPKAQNYPLLIPVYTESDRILAEESNPQKYPISRTDFDLTKKYLGHLGDKIALAKYDCEVKVLIRAKECFEEEWKYYDFSEDRSLYEPELILNRVFNYLGVRSKELEEFKELENEIVHFKKIRFSDGDKFEEIKKKVEEIKRTPQRQKELEEQYGKIPRREFERQMTLFEKASNFEIDNRGIRIKYLANHYYLPIIVSEAEKITYLNHIIDVESEIKFIEELEEYLDTPNNVFSQFDWWMFSKLDQTLDEVAIPYYNPNENKISNFKPDFIFWAQKGKKYLILFVDPKGTEHTDGYRKIDGYSKIFECGKQKECRDFSYNGYIVNAKLLLKPRQGVAGVLDNYKKYWFDNFVDFADKIS